MEPVLLENTVTPKRFGVITPDALDFQRYISPYSTNENALPYMEFCVKRKRQTM
jgi:hypothetical protein